VTELPHDAAPLFERIVQADKERVARAAQKVQQSKTPAEMRQALRELEEAVQALKKLADRENQRGPLP